MNKKVFILLGLLWVVIILSAVALKKTESANIKPESEKIESTEPVKVEKKATEKKKAEPKKALAKSIFETEQVVTEATYPRRNVGEEELMPDVLPKGTIVSVKPVENNDEWVEIISNPKKGFVEKHFLENRDIHIAAREAGRKSQLSPTQFKETVDQALAAFQTEKGGDISIYVESTDQSFNYNYHGDEVKRTASCIKLPFIAYTMTLADQQKIDLSTVLTYTENFRIDGTGIIQFEPIGGQYNLLQLAELVIRYSDNVAFLMLLNYIGEANFIQYLGELDAQSPNNRVFSTARILSKSMAYVNENKDKSKNMMGLFNWLQDSTFDDGVAVGLPGVDVAHKTGWMPMYTVSNDISLIKDEKRPYYLTIMTNGYDDTYSEQAIADLAQIIDKNMLLLVE